ncbi:hypothetical protein EDD18DRAFT_1355919 [Armillaria luteobubalina]|uniref:Uncharacterized protein n=1 Tax=Armillaria luteobubalina TaxID=153913 RepID=A0AA39URA9_9AGAR|nr:hypothetical protein EDD18DRAFT_1355919 [Armillaria luteobubalina]
MSGIITLYTLVVTDVSKAYWIAGAGLTIFQGTIGCVGYSMSLEWMDTIASAAYTLQKHLFLLIWAWVDFS